MTTPDVLHLDLPLRTRSAANARDAHWRTRHRITKAERLTTLAYWRKACGRPLAGNETAVVLIVRVAPYTLDDDNLPVSSKGVRDQIAQELGLKSDRDPRVTWVYEQQRGTKPRDYRVLVRVEYLRPEEP